MRGWVLLGVLAAASTMSGASLAQSSVAPDGGGCRVVVLNLLGKNLPAADVDVPGLLTETLANEVNVVSGCQVITQADVAQMLDFEATKAACEGGGDSCLSEIGSALGADRVIGGSLGKLGTEFVLNARLMNVRAGVVEARAEQVVPGAVEKLRLAAKNAARQLYGKPPTTDAATTTTTVTPPPPPPEEKGLPTLVVVGGAVAGVGALTAVVGGVLVGLAETRLSDPKETDKTGVIGEGQVAVAVLGAGVVVALVGGGLAVAALVME